MSHCLVCDEVDATRWTVADEDRAVMVDLCKEHSEPLTAVLAMGMARQREMDHDEVPAPTQVRKRPSRRMRPLSWTPPDEA